MMIGQENDRFLDCIDGQLAVLVLVLKGALERYPWLDVLFGYTAWSG